MRLRLTRGCCHRVGMTENSMAMQEERKTPIDLSKGCLAIELELKIREGVASYSLCPIGVR